VAVPQEFWYAFIPSVVAVLELWYFAYSSRIKERQRDLSAGEPERLRFVRDTLVPLKGKLSKSASGIEDIRINPNAKLTGQLRDELREVVDSVEEIDTIQDSAETVVKLMRQVRDRVFLFMIGGSLVILFFVISSYLPDYEFGLLVVGNLLFAYGLVALIFRAVVIPYRECKEINALLRKRDLDKQGKMD
jgi:hypothetical protein